LSNGLDKIILAYKRKESVNKAAFLEALRSFHYFNSESFNDYCKALAHVLDDDDLATLFIRALYVDDIAIGREAHKILLMRCN